jgi:hypothetical protein
VRNGVPGPERSAFCAPECEPPNRAAYRNRAASRNGHDHRDANRGRDPNDPSDRHRGRDGASLATRSDGFDSSRYVKSVDRSTTDSVGHKRLVGRTVVADGRRDPRSCDRAAD